MKSKVGLHVNELTFVGALICAMACPAIVTEATAQDEPKRGLGKVLLTDSKIPLKVVARRNGLNLMDEAGLPTGPFKPNVPYFVFEERDGKLRVDRVQDGDVAKQWVQKEDCHFWNSRRLAYPKNGGDISEAFALMFGDKDTLPSFDPTGMVPWPILAQSSDHSELTVLYTPPASVGGDSAPIRVRFVQLYDVHVLFSETELDKSLTNLIGLLALINSGKVKPEDASRVLGNFLSQNDMDFLDVDEVKRTLDLFPGGSPGYLLKADFKTRLERIRKSLDRQVPWIKKVATSKEAFNADHGVYIVPLAWLHETRAEGE